MEYLENFQLITQSLETMISKRHLLETVCKFLIVTSTWNKTFQLFTFPSKHSKMLVDETVKHSLKLITNRSDEASRRVQNMFSTASLLIIESTTQPQQMTQWISGKYLVHVPQQFSSRHSYDSWVHEEILNNDWKQQSFRIYESF